MGWMASVDVAPRRLLLRRAAGRFTRGRLCADAPEDGYEADRWSVYLWGRNVFDEDYIMRGFFFGNEPPLVENRRYMQLGQPRQFGVKVRWEF